MLFLSLDAYKWVSVNWGSRSPSGVMLRIGSGANCNMSWFIGPEITDTPLRRILGKSLWSISVRFAFAELPYQDRQSNIMAHSIDTYLFGARELDISIYP